MKIKARGLCYNVSMRINLREIFKNYERTLILYKALLPEKELARVSKMVLGVTKSIEPAVQMVKNKSFQRNLREINKFAEKVREIIAESHALTIPAIKAMEDLYIAVDDASKTIAPPSLSQEKREQAISRPLFKQTKLQIRKGIPSVKEILPLDLPSDVTWESIQAQFVDPHTLLIKVPKYNIKVTADYNEMGMWDGRSKQPNAQWALFKGLAKFGGEITWDSPIASPQVKKNKQLLSESLKRYFNIDGDPFELYRKEKAYRLKMYLTPYEYKESNTKSDDDDYYKESTPKLYESGSWISLE